jgi:hypothetical protein
LRDPQVIKQHPFFADIDFNELLKKRLKPPYKPLLKNAHDLGHFDEDIIELPIMSPVDES